MTDIKGVYSPENRRDAIAAFDEEVKQLRRRMVSGTISAVIIVGMASERSEAVFVATPNNFPRLVDATTAALREVHQHLHPDCEVCAANRSFLSVQMGAPLNPRDLN